MKTELNWQKIRSEFSRLTDVEQLKGEVQRIGHEIRNFDYHTVLSPAAQQKVKKFEKRYTVLMRSISKAQRQMDREFNRLLRQIKTQRTDVQKAVGQQKDMLEKAAAGFRKRFATKAKSAGKKATKKRASAKTVKSTRKKA